ncbi:MAG: hypothetical protein HQL87_14175 [Magnetococcales bacterium]|nr:hypothetical protein [Magnetococcales bacterium]
MNLDTLRQLVARCRCKGQRDLGWPREWCPNRIKQPGTDGYYFSDVGAWEFIADQLEAGHPYEELYLDKPPGALAIVMKIRLAPNVPLLYVKVQIGPGNKVLGRSFHYSNH